MRNVMRPQFQTIEGVGEVSIGGYRERNDPRLVRRRRGSRPRA